MTGDSADAGDTTGAAQDGDASDGRGSAAPREDSDLAAPERTMTRRELRILRARAEAAGLPAPDVMFLPNGESTVTGAIPVLDGVAFSSPDDTASEAPGIDAAETSASQADRSQADTSQTDAAPDAAEPDAVEIVVELAPEVDAAGVVSEQPTAEPLEPESARDRGPDASAKPVIIPALVEPDPAASARFPVGIDTVDDDPHAEIVVEAEPVTGDHPVAPERPLREADRVADSAGPPVPGSLRPFDALFLPPSARPGTEESSDAPLSNAPSASPVTGPDELRDDIVAARGGSAKPFGHWSIQDDEDDGTDGESALSRAVGTGVLTTHALVLPSVPDAGEPLMSPLTSTGEVMVTGIVELPKSFGSTGAHPALFDHPEVDSLIDDADREDAESGAAPVRATRAVSSTTTTRSMVDSAPSKRSRVLPFVGIGVGAVVLVGVALWALATFVFNVF